MKYWQEGGPIAFLLRWIFFWPGTPKVGGERFVLKSAPASTFEPSLFLQSPPYRPPDISTLLVKASTV